MPKRMLIDSSHPEETRVVVLSGNRLEEFDYEAATKKQIKGNIYLAKITRVEPSLQAAFVEYGGNRHGFLPFSEIHPDYYRIPISDREALIEEQATEIAADDSDRPEPSEQSGESGGPIGDEAGDSDDSGEPDDSGAPDDALAAKGGEEQGDQEEGRDPESGSEETRIALAEMPRVEATAAAPGEVEEVPVETKIDTVGGEEVEEEARRRARLMRRYKIQEVIKRRQVILVQVTKEERGTKGAALTTYLSLAGRYCVLMPNTGKGGGISRKISSAADRRRLKQVIGDLEIPEGMAVIVRTAGSERSKAEIRRDYDYLIKLWAEIRDTTLKSTAPSLIYEEASLIKRSIRDLYTRDMDEILVEGEEGYKQAKDFMKSLIPSHARKVQLYKNPTVPLFVHSKIEDQLDAMHSPTLQLKSGGSLVLNQTEALVAIDVNSGKATRERHIEETALKTNLEAADEIARQLRLRDLAGLIVIDFIDMEDGRHNRDVERRFKEAMRHDRARIQFGRISPFGLLEMSRQRLRPSLSESSTIVCPHCHGSGRVRSIDSTALHILRAIQEEGIRRRGGTLRVALPSAVAMYLINQKRERLSEMEQHYELRVEFAVDDTLVPPNHRLERRDAHTRDALPHDQRDTREPQQEARSESADAGEEDASDRRRRRRRGGRRGHGERDEAHGGERRPAAAARTERPVEDEAPPERDEEDAQEVRQADEREAGDQRGRGARQESDRADGERRGRRRRGRRGGRRRREAAEARARSGAADSGPDENRQAESGDLAAQAAGEPAPEQKELQSEPPKEPQEERDDGGKRRRRGRRGRGSRSREQAAGTPSSSEISDDTSPDAETGGGESPSRESQTDDTVESAERESSSENGGHRDNEPSGSGNGHGRADSRPPVPAAETHDRTPPAGDDERAQDSPSRRRGWWQRWT